MAFGTDSITSRSRSSARRPALMSRTMLEAPGRFLGGVFLDLERTLHLCNLDASLQTPNINTVEGLNDHPRANALPRRRRGTRPRLALGSPAPEMGPLESNVFGA